jgi:exopolysaccharide biosynthesis polyprenyl glycosylphosphotransferase
MTALSAPNLTGSLGRTAKQVVPPLGSRVAERRHLRHVAVMDVSTAYTASALALVLRFGTQGVATSHLVTGVTLPLVWLLLLRWARAYELRFLHTAGEESHRILQASAGLVLATAFVSYAFKLELARGYVLPLVVIITSATLSGRWLLRERLAVLRSKGAGWMLKVIVGGDPDEVDRVVATVAANPHAGFEVAGVCLSEPPRQAYAVPVTLGLDAVAQTASAAGADAVVILPCKSFGPVDVRRLGWQLGAADIHLMVGPALTDIARQRTTVTPIGSMSLVHVHPAELTGGRRLVKGGFDRLVALISLMLVFPFLLLAMVAVKLETPGPALFRQERVGWQDRRFKVVKLRTMVIDAEERRSELLDHNEADGALFKIADDPRITPLGRLLRRYSIDEVPQLVNVLLGQMSLVGPRPALVSEVEQYVADERRRLVVKPGLTGLWQVSGRSDLPWEESVRLDLKYVDNWSIALDLRIIWKTVRAVVSGKGAY